MLINLMKETTVGDLSSTVVWMDWVVRKEGRSEALKKECS